MTNKDTWCKIDRAMCNQCWFDMGLNGTAHFHPSGYISDHSPCVVSLFESPK